MNSSSFGKKKIFFEIIKFIIKLYQVWYKRNKFY